MEKPFLLLSPEFFHNTSDSFCDPPKADLLTLDSAVLLHIDLLSHLCLKQLQQKNTDCASKHQHSQSHDVMCDYVSATRGYFWMVDFYQSSVLLS